MLRASATVIHLGRIEMVKDGSNPSRRPMRAVEYNENTVEMTTEVKISAECLLTSFLCLNMEKAKDIITDPKNPIRMSPAPGFEETFVR